MTRALAGKVGKPGGGHIGVGVVQEGGDLSREATSTTALAAGFRLLEASSGASCSAD